MRKKGKDMDAIFSLAFGFIVTFSSVLSTVSADDGYVVVVNPSVAIGSISKRELKDIFLKEKTTWRDGSKVIPFDLKKDSPLRETFSQAILNKSVQEMLSYWIAKQVSVGIQPPKILDSAQIVIRFVSSQPGAVGYVDVSAVNASVKVITVQ